MYNIYIHVQYIYIVDYHVAAYGLIPGGNGVKTKLHVLRKGQ